MAKKLEQYVESLSVDFNVDKIIIHRIITTYVKACRNSLKNGLSVPIGDLCRIDRTDVDNNYYITTSFLSTLVSQELKTTKNMTDIVINAYLNALKQDFISGEDVEIRGLVLMKHTSTGGLCTEQSDLLHKYVVEEGVKNPLRVHSMKGFLYDR